MSNSTGERSKVVRIGEWFVVLAIIIALAAVLYPAVQQVRQYGPSGMAIPSTMPIEDNRVSHPSGLSIIAPPNWVQKPDLNPDVPSLYIVARSGHGGRSPAAIALELRSVPVDGRPPQFTPTQFQGYPGYEKMEVTRRWSLDDPAMSEYTLFVNRNDNWYEVHYTILESRETLPDAVQEYLDTIEWPREE